MKQHLRSRAILAALSTVAALFLLADVGRQHSTLDGCKHVYLDVGSNVGLQVIKSLIVSNYNDDEFFKVRKLFEPQYYPEAKVMPIFNRAFGPIE